MSKRKICIGIVFILITISLISIIGIFKKDTIIETSEMAETNDKDFSEVENVVNEILVTNEGINFANTNGIHNDITLNSNNNTINNVNKKSNTIVKKENIVAVAKKEDTIKKEQTTTPVTTDSKPQESKTEKKSTKTSTTAVKGNDKVSSQTSVQIQAVKDNKKESSNKPSQENKDIPKEEPKNEELYVRNDAMINTIKQIIESNATDDMKNFGYTIVVDGSIKGITNQFTFTENRVKAYIQNKFGTIRIYAEDYYKNGQLIMTECYII